MNPDQLGDPTMNPQWRRLVQVGIQDAHAEATGKGATRTSRTASGRALLHDQNSARHLVERLQT
jgi:DNA gyrase/topoisomerase IV subunit B